jgi:hypothetical protein
MIQQQFLRISYDDVEYPAILCFVEFLYRSSYLYQYLYISMFGLDIFLLTIGILSCVYLIEMLYNDDDR